RARAVAPKRRTGAVGLGAAPFPPVAWCGPAGAVVSTVMAAPEPFKDGQLLPPEVAGMKLALRTVWPLLVALAGTLPVVAARRAHVNGNSPIPAAIQAGAGAPPPRAGRPAAAARRRPA